MNLSPLDISKHEFSRSLRGYDPAEVHAFLDRVADEITMLQQQTATLLEQNRTSAARLATYQDMEQNLHESLLALQESQRQSRELTEQERQQILREARLDAEQMKLGTQREIMALEEELRALKVHHDAYVKRLRFLLRAQTELIDLLEQESPHLRDDKSETPTR